MGHGRKTGTDPIVDKVDTTSVDVCRPRDAIISALVDATVGCTSNTAGRPPSLVMERVRKRPLAVIGDNEEQQEQQPQLGSRRERKHTLSRTQEEDEISAASRGKRDTLELVKSVMQQGDYAKARALCDEAFRNVRHENHRRRARLHLMRSTVLLKDGDAHGAVRDARDAVILSPNDPLCYLQAAKALHAAQHRDKARTALAKAESLSQGGETHITAQIERLFQQWNQPDILRLPAELLQAVLSHFDTLQIARWQRVCKQWRRHIRCAPALWQNLDYGGAPYRSNSTLSAAVKQLQTIKALSRNRTRLLSLHHNANSAELDLLIASITWSTLEVVDILFDNIGRGARTTAGPSGASPALLREIWSLPALQALTLDMRKGSLNLPHINRFVSSRSQLKSVKLSNILSTSFLDCDGSLPGFLSSTEHFHLGVHVSTLDMLGRVLYHARAAIKDFQYRATTLDAASKNDYLASAEAGRSIVATHLEKLEIHWPRGSRNYMMTQRIVAPVRQLHLSGTALSLLRASIAGIVTAALQELTVTIDCEDDCVSLSAPLAACTSLSKFVIDFGNRTSAGLDSMLDTLAQNTSVPLQEIEICHAPDAHLGSLIKLIYSRVRDSQGLQRAPQPIQCVSLFGCDNLTPRQADFLRANVNSIVISSQRRS